MRATSTTSAPASSHRSAISLMKLIDAARYALDACLAISAVRTSVVMIGRPSGLYNAATRRAAAGVAAPITNRSARLKLSTADPNRRNSGTHTTSGAARGFCSRRIVPRWSQVPTGTCALTHSRRGLERCRPISRTASWITPA